MNRKGLILINTGPGKGKTTAAFGLALRALGQGFKVLILQFMKGRANIGEIKALAHIDLPLEIQQVGRDVFFKSRACEPIDIYLGPQVALVRYSQVDVTAPAGSARTRISVDDDLGWGLMLGLDYHVGQDWLAHVNLRYVDTNMSNDDGVPSLKTRFDPVILSLGVGYRF